MQPVLHVLLLQIRLCNHCTLQTPNTLYVVGLSSGAILQPPCSGVLCAHAVQGSLGQQGTKEGSQALAPCHIQVSDNGEAKGGEVASAWRVQ